MIDSKSVPVAKVSWSSARRIIRSAFPPIDLFEDIADPADWPLLISAEQKTNPRLMATIGNLDLVPPARRVSGTGASYLMAPFTHVSTDRPSRFTDGHYGVLYVGNQFEVALFETIHHHALFMARTKEVPGWTSQFREVIVDVEADLHDLRGNKSDYEALLNPNDYTASQSFARQIHQATSEGIAYPSIRYAAGEAVALFYPDSASNPRQGRHIDYHWDGERVDLYRDAGSGQVYRIV